MKQALFLITLFCMIGSCRKPNEESKSNYSNNQISQNLRQGHINGNFIFRKSISRTDYLSCFTDSSDFYYQFAANHIQDSVDYFLCIINDTILKQIVKYDLYDSAFVISNAIASIDTTENNLSISYNENEIIINDELIVALQPFYIYDPNNIPVAEVSNCCNACYIVHDILDIHELDCLCCLMSCGWCGPIFRFNLFYY